MSHVGTFLRSKSAPLVAFVVLGIGGSLAVSFNAKNSTRADRQIQYVACVKANALVKESNSRVKATQVLTEAVSDFLRDASVSREVDYEQSHHASDAKAAEKYRNLKHRVDTEVKYHRTDPIPCIKP